MLEFKTLQKKIQNRNLVAIFIVVVLVSISFISLMVGYTEQKNAPQIINIAGSQRMLSQKIAYLSHLHRDNLTHQNIHEEIKKQLMESAYKLASNQRLLTGLALDNSHIIPEEVTSMYLNSPSYLNQRIESYVTRAVSLSKTKNINIAANILNKQFSAELTEKLLVDLDKAVVLIEEHINERVAFIEKVRAVLWFFSMVLLVAICFYIFRPLQNLINRSYVELFLAKQESSELNFAINQHAIVYRIDIDDGATITKVNQRFIDFYRYKEDEVIGLSVKEVCSNTYPQEYFDNIFKRCITNDFWHGISLNKIKGGRELWLNTTIVPMKNNEKKIESFIVIQTDISGIKHTELALNQLHLITSDIDKTLDDKIQGILTLGKDIFNLPIALISEINNQEYCVVYCSTPNNDILPGATFALGNTYCTHTLLAGKPTSFHEAGKSEIKDHPCYINFKLESYIGVPLIVSGKLFGTLNFSSPEPASRPFNERELELIQLFAHWISAELTRGNNENKMLAQQKLMRQMGQQARIGVWEIDMMKNNIYWSKMTKKIHEVEDDFQPDFESAVNFYKEGESRETIQTLVAKTIADGTPFERELQLVTANGNEVWVSARGRAEHENGECVRLFGSIQDVTDKVLTQHKISEHNKRMELAADSARMGIWEINLISGELTWDDWMFRLYGIEGLNHRDPKPIFSEMLHPEDRERMIGLLQNAIVEHKNLYTQFRILWPNGEIKHIKSSAVVSYDNDMKPVSVIGVNYDVTMLVENEIALTKAKDQAEIAVTAKNEFFASMSHEIRTPMNGVIGMLDLVKESDLNQEQRHRIGIAQQSAKSLLSLINDVLDFSKIDANKLELENISFNLSKMVGGLAEAFAQQAQHKNLELIVDLVDMKECLVVGDSNRIRQILTNLVANAIKFTKIGEVTIRLRQQDYSNSQWRILIDISDTGIGIPKAKQSALFEAFSQVDASTTREYGGTGLGLAIVKKLCACMQGKVTLESEEGKGSRFTCELILDKSADSVIAAPSELVVGKRVLVIENNESSGEVVTRQLNTWQIDAKLITSGKAALALLIEQAEDPQFDLVIMNRHMPDLEGLAFLQKLKAYPKLQQLKIMFTTLMVSQNDIANIDEIGICGHFPKPVTPCNLYQALNIMLGVEDSDKDCDLDTASLEGKNLADNRWMQNIRLLLVEDNRVNQMVAIGVLKKIGIENPVIAVNGKDALAKLKSSDSEQPFNFIFMDCQMPEMDGYQATKLIREGAAGERYRDISIVAMTANAMQGDEEKCLVAGMNDYLVKPINKDKIYDTLRIFLGKT